MVYNNNKDIILEVYGGLGNRMRVIASGIWLAKQSNKSILLIWDENKDLNCPFEELFDSIPNLKCISKKKVYFLFRSALKKPFWKRLIISCINVLLSSKFIIIEDADVKMIQHNEIDILALSKSVKTLYFRTCEEFGNNYNEYKHFIPKSDIQLKINEQCCQFNSNTIGVHIRRTDHEIAIRSSPTELFIQRIKEDLEMDPDINYFLSTDDAATEVQLKLLFGDKIMFTHKEYSRNNPRGIKDALIDMYCLANTSKIYGSYWSSFSDIASRINNIPLEILQK